MDSLRTLWAEIVTMDAGTIAARLAIPATLLAAVVAHLPWRRKAPDRDRSSEQ